MYSLSGVYGGSGVFCSPPAPPVIPSCPLRYGQHLSCTKRGVISSTSSVAKWRQGGGKWVFFPSLIFPFFPAHKARQQWSLLPRCPVWSQLTHLLVGLECLFPFPCRTGSLIISSFEFKQCLILVGANIIRNGTAGDPGLPRQLWRLLAGELP